MADQKLPAGLIGRTAVAAYAAALGSAMIGCGDKAEWNPNGANAQPTLQPVPWEQWVDEESTAAPDEGFGPIYRDILLPRCGTLACHETGSAFAAGHLTALSFDGGLERSFRQLVGAGSTQAIGWKRIDPDAPERSYLLAKLIGVPGITGAPMPPAPFSRLESSEVTRIVEWVRRGAPLDLETESAP